MTGYEDVYSFCPRCKQLKASVGAQTIPGEPGVMRLMCSDCRDDVIKRGKSQHETPEWSPAKELERRVQEERAERIEKMTVSPLVETPVLSAEQSLHEALEEFIPAMWGALAALQRKLQGKEK